MKKRKKITVILIVIIAFSLIIFKIFANKRQMDNELKSLQEFNRVVPVEVVQVKSEKSVSRFEEFGKFRSKSEITILAETQGKVLTFNGNVGDFIMKGRTIAIVEKDVLESQFQSATLNLAKAESDLKRYKNMTIGEAVTQQQLENSNLNYQNALTNYTNVKKQLDNTTIKATVSGIISKISTAQGAFLSPSSAVMVISEIDPIIFVIKVSEEKLINFQTGQSVNITIDALPGKTLKGNVKSIGVNPDLADRYEIEITTGNYNNIIRPGMDGKAEFMFNENYDNLVLPRKCIVGSIEAPQVFILNNNVSVKLKTIKVLAINDRLLAVTEGLKAGDKIVLSGQINLQEGSLVKVINK